LRGFETHLPGQLAGGVRQRVALARALIMARPIMLMDEPFGALDAQTKIVMQEELLRIFDETRKTIVFVTHAIEEAILLGDEVIVMTARPGRIKEVITVDLPRPRSLELVSTKAFGMLFDRAFHLIREEVMKSLEQQAAMLEEAQALRARPPHSGVDAPRTHRGRVRRRLGGFRRPARNCADLPAGAKFHPRILAAHDRGRLHGF
jgi:ABC-type proline/glycine betaine transport system ATPase subunit